MKWITLALAILAIQLQPVISITPTSAEPGAGFVVTGSGFPAGERVKVSWDGANLGGTVRVSADGSFEVSGVVPADAGPGAHVVEASAIGGGTASAAATLTVAGPTTTSTSSTSTTSTSTPPTSTPPPTTADTAAPDTAAPGTVAPDTVAPDTLAAPVVTAAPATTPDAPTSPSSTVTGAVSEDAAPPPTVPLDAEPPSTTAAAASASEPVAGSPSDGGGLLVPALVMLVIGGSIAFLLAGRSRSRDRSEAPPAAQPVPVDDGREPTALAPIGAAAVASEARGWRRRMLEMAPPGDLDGMLQVDDRLYGWGRSTSADGGDVAHVWASSDGVRWSGVAELAGMRVPLAVPWRGGLLVAGMAVDGAPASTECWWSADGTTWEDLRGPVDGSLTGVALGGLTAGHGTLLGWGTGPDDAGLWVSHDGASWDRSGISGSFDLVAPIATGFVAFGRDREHRRAIVARSADGESWARAGDETRFGFDGATVATLVSVDEGMVAAGTDIMRGVAAVWVSDDGLAWYRVPLEETAGTTIETLLVVGGDRLVAVGSDTGRRKNGRGSVVVWESTDVVSWHRLDTGEAFRSAAIDAVGLVDGSLTASGTLFVERGAGRAEPVPVGWTWSPSTPSSVSDRRARVETPV